MSVRIKQSSQNASVLFFPMESCLIRLKPKCNHWEYLSSILIGSKRVGHAVNIHSSKRTVQFVIRSLRLNRDTQKKRQLAPAPAQILGSLILDKQRNLKRRNR